MISLNDDKNTLVEFMRIVMQFIREKTDFQVWGFNESPTVSDKVMRLSVFLGEKGYNGQADMFSYARELGDYLNKHFPEAPQELMMPCPDCDKDCYPS
jgi:hypothetical protein